MKRVTQSGDKKRGFVTSQHWLTETSAILGLQETVEHFGEILGAPPLMCINHQPEEKCPWPEGYPWYRMYHVMNKLLVPPLEF